MCLKNLVVTTPQVIPLDFQMYEGKGSSIALDDAVQKLDIGGKVVLKLSEFLPPGTCICMNRHFPSIALLDLMLGGVWDSHEFKLKSESKLKKKGKVIRSNGSQAFIKWYDS